MSEKPGCRECGGGIYHHRTCSMCDAPLTKPNEIGVYVSPVLDFGRMAQTTAEVESIAFESEQPDRGYTVKARYLKDSGDALVEVFKGADLVRSFLFPAYAVWNIAAHFPDIVDDEIQKFRHSVYYWREDHYAD